MLHYCTPLLRDHSVTALRWDAYLGSVEAIRKTLMHRMSDLEIEQAVRAMPKAERARFLREARTKRD